MAKWPWIERTLPFDYPPTKFPDLLETDWGKAAFHRRLGKSLRIVDIACMIGEHDDCHLARVRELIRFVRR